MNKILLTITAVICIAGSTLAQKTSTTKNNLKLGLKVGTNYSNVFDSKTEKFNAEGKFGFVAGGFLEIPITEYFAFQPEILYNQKGFKGTGVILGSEYSMTRTTNFIDVPLLFSVKPSKYFSLLFGPQYSYLFRQTDEYQTEATNISFEKEFSNDNIRKNIFGVLAGFDVSADKIRFGVRAGWDIQNNNGDGTSNTPRYRNTWYQATMGIIL